MRSESESRKAAPTTSPRPLANSRPDPMSLPPRSMPPAPTPRLYWARCSNELNTYSSDPSSSESSQLCLGPEFCPMLQQKYRDGPLTSSSFQCLQLAKRLQPHLESNVYCRS